MTRDFLKPQKTTGLDTNAPAGKRSRFAPDPLPKPVQAQPQQPDLQTLIQRGLRLNDPMAKAWGDLLPVLDSADQPSVQAKPEQPDLETMIQRGLRLGDPMAKAWANTQPTVQREAIPEEEKEENLQTKADEAVQRQELEEEETLQTNSEPSLQREELPEEEEETVQTKLTIGQPGDKYEQEADNMAAQVLSMPDPTTQNVQRQETEEETLQQKPLANSVTPVVQRQTSETPQQDSTSQSLESQLAAEKGSGSLLSDEVRGFMEPRFGADFSEVKVHTGSAAVQMNQQLGAQAFTHGNDIYYGKGKAPGNDALTAHELTHVVQQNPVKISPAIQLQENQQSSSKNDPNKLKTAMSVEKLIRLFLTDREKFLIGNAEFTKDWIRGDGQDYIKENIRDWLRAIQKQGNVERFSELEAYIEDYSGGNDNRKSWLRKVVKHFNKAKDRLTVIERERKFLGLLTIYAKKTDNTQLLKHLKLISKAIKESKGNIEKLAELLRANSGRRLTKPGAAVSLLADAILGAVDLALGIIEAEDRIQNQEALVDLIEGAKDLGIEAYPILERQLTLLGSGDMRNLLKRSVTFIDQEDTEARIEARKKLREYVQKEIEKIEKREEKIIFNLSPKDPVKENLLGALRILDYEIKELESGKDIETGGRINIYYFLPIPSGVVESRRQK